jgi:hypothetical protein
MDHCLSQGFEVVLRQFHKQAITPAPAPTYTADEALAVMINLNQQTFAGEATF